MPGRTKTTRVNDAYVRLKDEIRHNRMEPGFQATEPELAAQLNMSRTPVREALIRLEAEGLVELIPRRGMRVLPIRPDDMAEIYEILTVLEPAAAAGLAARALASTELAPLERAMDAMEQALDDDDLDAWAAADDQFHRTLLTLHGNSRMADIVGLLFDQAHRVRLITRRMRGAPVTSTAEHRVILNHVIAGDAPAARRAFRVHRQRAAGELLDILERYQLGHL